MKILFAQRHFAKLFSGEFTHFKKTFLRGPGLVLLMLVLVLGFSMTKNIVQNAANQNFSLLHIADVELNPDGTIKGTEKTDAIHTCQDGNDGIRQTNNFSTNRYPCPDWKGQKSMCVHVGKNFACSPVASTGDVYKNGGKISYSCTDDKKSIKKLEKNERGEGISTTYIDCSPGVSYCFNTGNGYTCATPGNTGSPPKPPSNDTCSSLYYNCDSSLLNGNPLPSSPKEKVTMQDCNTACFNDTGCQGWIIDTTNLNTKGTCTLMADRSAAETLTYSPKGGSTANKFSRTLQNSKPPGGPGCKLANPGDICDGQNFYSPQQDFYSYINPDPNLQTYQDCQFACQADDKRCVAWTFQKQTKMCYEKGGIVGPNQDQNTISGIVRLKTTGGTGSTGGTSNSSPTTQQQANTNTQPPASTNPPAQTSSCTGIQCGSFCYCATGSGGKGCNGGYDPGQCKSPACVNGSFVCNSK